MKMKVTIYIYSLLALICACEGNVNYVSTQGSDSSDVSKNKKSTEGKKDAGGTSPSTETEEILEGIEILDEEGCPKEIVFGCGKENLADDTKITICLQKDINTNIKSDIKKTIKADINSNTLWKKLEGNFYTKITLDNVGCRNLTPKLFGNISKKLKHGGKLEIIGLPNYLPYNNNEPNKILFWEKDNCHDRSAINYFDRNKSPTNWHNWNSSEDAISITNAAPYRIPHVEDFLAFKNDRSLFSSDKNKLITDAYENRMKPFKVANDLVDKKLKGKSWKKNKCFLGFIRNSKEETEKESGEKSQQDSLIYIKAYFDLLSFRYEKIEGNSITFIKQEDKNKTEKIEEVDSNSKKTPKQPMLKK